MIHFCIFGSQEGTLSAEKRAYVTLFGACELRQPTMAKRILEERQLRTAGRATIRQSFFLTMFGTTSVKLPTLAEEYLDLQEAMRSGALSVGEWDAAMAQLSAESGNYASFTAFGAFEAAELPSEKEEVEGLALNRHLGHIPDEAGKTLELAVGSGGSQRAAVIRQALGRSLPAHA